MTRKPRKLIASPAPRLPDAGLPWQNILPWAVLAAVAATTVWAYWPAMNGGLLWDDDAHLTRPGLRSAGGLISIWWPIATRNPAYSENAAPSVRKWLPGATQQYYPLLHSFFWVQHRLWGDHTLGYHIVNLLLHLTAVLLAYLVLRRLRVPGALLAASIFALHPVHVETVAWITEQKNTLSTVFYLAAMLAYLNFHERRDVWSYALAIDLFVLGLLSKTVTATLPAALLVVFWWQGGTVSWRRDVLPFVPFFLIGAAFGGLTAWVEWNFIGAQGDEFELSLLARCLLAGRVIWFYLGKLIWPANLVFFYHRWEIDPAQWWQWTFLFAAIAVSIVLWRIRGRWRAPLAAWLFFIGTLFPVLGFLNVYPFRFSFVADHFQYLASLGPIALASSLVALGVKRLPREAGMVAVVAVAVIIGGLAYLTREQTRMYSDMLTLFRTTTERNPLSWVAFNNLGATLMSLGRPQEAIDPLNEALRLKHDYADALNNLGKARIATGGTPQEAMIYFEKAIQYHPDSGEAYNNLGNALLNSGRPQDAIPPLQKALSLIPNYGDARLNLGVVLFKLERPQEALVELEKAVVLRPHTPEALCNYGAVLLSVGRREECLPYLTEAAVLKPNYLEAWGNLALAHAALGHTAEAINCAQQTRDIARANGLSTIVQRMENLLVELRAGAAKRAAPVPSPLHPPQ